MIDAEQLKKNIIRDMRVELSEEFDKNFERKAFFTKKWKKRADPDAKGSLLVVTGTLRRSIKAEERPNGVRFSSAVPRNRKRKRLQGASSSARTMPRWWMTR